MAIWWSRWKRDTSDLATYRFARPWHSTAGLLSLTTRRHERHGMRLVVHDFWAADQPAATAMLAFLGRHHTPAPAPSPSGAASSRPTPPSSTGSANTDLTTEVPIRIENETGGPDQWMLQIKDGAAELAPTRAEGQVTFTRRQLAVWYAGGYRSATSARMAGVHAVSEEALATLARSTAQHEPWLPDHF